MFRPGNVARKIQSGPGRDTKLIINGRRERRTGEWHVARTPTRPVHRLPRSMPVFVTHDLRNFGLADAQVCSLRVDAVGYSPVPDERCGETRPTPGSPGSPMSSSSPVVPPRLTRRPHRSCRPYWRAIALPLGNDPSPARWASAHCHACRCSSRPVPLPPAGLAPRSPSPEKRGRGCGAMLSLGSCFGSCRERVCWRDLPLPAAPVSIRRPPTQGSGPAHGPGRPSRYGPGSWCG